MITLAELSADISGRRTQKRRKHPRAGIDWPVTVITHKANYHGKTVNISRGGALIHLADPLTLGEHVRLAVEIPECQDTILAKAEIVRVYPLKRGSEQQFSHGIALKFTEITAENLKFFSGNLAPEWKEDFSEIDRYPQTNQSQPKNLSIYSEKQRHYALWFSTFILIISLAYLFFLSIKQKTDYQLMATRLDKRLMIIEEQIESFDYTKDSLAHLASKLNDLEIELSALEENLSASDTLASINVELQHQNQLIQEIFDEVGIYQKPFSVESKIEEKKEEEEFFLVQRGDNLNQTSLKTGITIRELRILNNLHSNNQIIAGQSLLIK